MHDCRLMTTIAPAPTGTTDGHSAERHRPESAALERGYDTAAFFGVFRETIGILEHEGIPYAIIGGIASTGYGRPRWTHDIDVLVRPEDADRTLDALDRAGFHTEKTDRRWLYKGFKHRVMVDIIFRSSGDIRLDAEMIARTVEVDVLGCRPRFVPPEDLLVMKAVVHDEGTPRHWHDALGVISANALDWSYLLRRARRAPRRVLSLLIYAHSLDLHVPNRVIRELFELVYGE